MCRSKQTLLVTSEVCFSAIYCSDASSPSRYALQAVSCAERSKESEGNE